MRGPGTLQPGGSGQACHAVCTSVRAAGFKADTGAHVKTTTFTIESQGYNQYLFRRAILPRLGWAAGAVGAYFALMAFFG